LKGENKNGILVLLQCCIQFSYELAGFPQANSQQWVISENTCIHTYTMGSFLEFQEQGGVLGLEIERHWGYL